MADHKIYSDLIVAGETTLTGAILSELKLGNASSAETFHTVTVNGSETNRGIDLVLKGAGYVRVPEGYETAISGIDRALVNKKYSDTKIGGHDTVMTDPGEDALLWRDDSDDTIKFAKLADSLAVAAGVLGVVDDKSIQQVTVRKNGGADIGSRSRINFVEGSNVSLGITEDDDNNEIKVTIAASGGGGGAMNVTIVDDDDLTSGEYNVPSTSGLYLYAGTAFGIFNMFLPTNTGADIWIKNISDFDLLVRGANDNELQGITPITSIQLEKGMVLHLVADGTHHQIMQS